MKFQDLLSLKKLGCCHLQILLDNLMVKKNYTSETTVHFCYLLDISKSKGLSEILRDIGTSTYQICRIEEKVI